MNKLLKLSLIILLTSCVTPPRKQVKLNFKTPAPPEETQMVKLDSAWWHVFNDAGLNQVLAETLRRNGNLIIAASNIQAAAAQAKIAGAPLFPQLSGSLQGSKRKQNFIGFPIPGSTSSVLSTESTTYGLALNVSWELDLWGRLRAGKAAAVAQLQASQADYIGAQLSLVGQVCKIWFAVIASNRQMELSKATLENQQLSSDRVKRRYESGLTSSLDVRLSRSNLARAQADYSASQLQYENTLRQLETLLWQFPDANIAHSSALPTLSADVPEGLSANLLNRRPDLAAAERRLAAAGATVSGAKRALLPQISLTGSRGTSSNMLDDLLNGDFSVWNLAGNIMQPLFQGGKLRANVSLAKSQEEIALMQYQNSALHAFSEVGNALSSEKYLKEQEEALRTAVEQALAARDLAETQYSRGVIDFITMLETQRTAFDMERQYLNVSRQRLDARVDLYLALGGGFEVETKSQVDSL